MQSQKSRYQVPRTTQGLIPGSMESSLLAKALYRVRIENGRAIYAEPIPIGHRIRDIAETANGSIVLKTDDNFLVYLEPAG